MPCMLGAQLHQSAYLHGGMPNTMHPCMHPRGARPVRTAASTSLLSSQSSAGKALEKAAPPPPQLGERLQVAHERDVAGRQYLHTNLLFALLYRHGCTTPSHLLIQLQRLGLRLVWQGGCIDTIDESTAGRASGDGLGRWPRLGCQRTHAWSHLSNVPSKAELRSRADLAAAVAVLLSARCCEGTLGSRTGRASQSRNPETT